VLTRLAIFICTFGYIGYFPIAPGTVGSLAGLAVYALLRWLGLPATADAAVIVALFFAGVWSGTHAERYFGTTDPGPGVIDEVVGMLITLFAVPATWPVVLAGFVVFRVLDIVKPYPARRFEALHGGMGMMADDVMSSVYANLMVRAAVWLAPGWLL
jgi:phosphatidylglycerophosphatase A